MEFARTILWPQHSGKKERAVLVSVQLSRESPEEAEDSLEELKQLTQTAGVQIIESFFIKAVKPTPNFYIGKGKAEQIAMFCHTHNVDVVIFNNDLTPAQAKNLQNLFGVKVIDRTELILDIFAQHAKSKEGKIQVQLAQLEYMLPRLVHAWTHLSRQWGGVGTRGPGEKQLELDRRRIRERISSLKKELKEIHNHRHLLRKSRERRGIPLVALIGYTNAGKTTLFNAITNEFLQVEDKLFTTLDTTVRKIIFPGNQTVLISDTVGFIRDLPHHLVEAFKATLEEVYEADLLLHVVDSSSRDIQRHNEVVKNLLGEMKVNKSVITVFNKMDKEDAKFNYRRILNEVDKYVLVSAMEKTGLDELLKLIEEELKKLSLLVRLCIPHVRMEVVSRIYEVGNVISTEYGEDTVKIEAEVPKVLAGEFESWIVEKV